jgi:tryptophan synthase alpha chain
MNPFKKDTKQISIFITAGYPTLESTTEQILVLQSKGVDFIEVGIPFSDPMADGPVIQETSAIALANGMQMDILFDQLASIQDQVRIPLVLMGYLNPVLQYGIDKFLSKCKELSIASVILPDMSLELYERLYKTQFEKYEIAVSFLITPLTDDDRIQKIAQVSAKSFVYLVSVTSITGGKIRIDEKVVNRYDEIKELCGETPMMIGFGISNSSDVKNAQKHSDGAIIGSAYLKALNRGESIVFVEELYC